jgi:regulatory protein
MKLAEKDSLMENEIIIESITKKKKGYTVKTNEGTYLFDEDTLIQHTLSKNKTISKKEFDRIMEDLAFNKNFNRTIQYLKYGMRSVFEIRKYLKEETHIEKIIFKLQQLGYVDDGRLARLKMDYYYRQGKGPNYIRQKLLQIHIENSIIEAVMQEYKENEQINIIEKQIDQASKQNKILPVAKQKQKIYQKLLRNGFDSSTILSILNKTVFVDESDEQLMKDLNKIWLRYENKLNQTELKQKVYAALLNKGYSYAKIKDAWEQLQS